MFKGKPLNPLNNKKCFECKFCVWDEEKKEEGCCIKGCVDNACFQEFKVIASQKK